MSDLLPMPSMSGDATPTTAAPATPATWRSGAAPAATPATRGTPMQTPFTSSVARTPLAANVPRPSLAQFYAGKYVMITGATGFLGKTVLEMLLRQCPDVAGAYLLVRPKKNVDPKTRVAETVKSELFNVLRESNPTFTDKVHCVQGDLVLPGLGLSEEDAAILRERINVVIHCAATVNFNEKLRLSLDLNVLSVQQMLAFARQFKHLSAFVHTSTAYSQCDQDHIEERFYEPPVSPNALISLVRSLPATAPDTLEGNLATALNGRRPNTYTFTKALAEAVIRTEGADMPVAVMRPSIVGAIHRGPIPGWQDNVNGPGGMYLTATMGILRVMQGHNDAISDIIPVDHCASMLLSIGWLIGTGPARPPTEDPPVFNCTSGAKNPITWSQQIDYAKRANSANVHRAKIVPIIPGEFTFVESKAVYEFWRFLLHTIPAKAADTVLRLQGKKPAMARLYRRLDSSIGAYTPFTTHAWTWDAGNVAALAAAMSPEDRENFNFDAATIDWPTYIFNYYLGTERFIPASLPGNPARNRVLSWLLVASFYTVQFFAAVFLFYYVFGERIQNQLFGEDSILSPLEQPAIIELEDDFAGGMAAGGSPIAGDL